MAFDPFSFPPFPSSETDIGNSKTKQYSDTVTYNDNNTDTYYSDSDDEDLTSNSTGTNVGTTTNIGDSGIGTYTTTGNYTIGSTATSTTTDDDQTVYDTVTTTDNSSLTGHGNNTDGTYFTTTSYTNTTSEDTTTVDLSLSINDSSDTTEIGVSYNSGDSSTGDYSITIFDNTTGNGSDGGNAGARNFTDTYTDSSGTTSTETGNSDDMTDSLTSTVIAGSAVTTTDTYSDGSSDDTQTVTSGSSTTYNNYEDDGLGDYYEDNSYGTSSQDTYETGSSNSYTLTATATSSFNDDEDGNADGSGGYTLNTSSTDQDSSTLTGIDSDGNTFTIVQTDDTGGTVETFGDDNTGSYTATAIGYDDTTTVESIFNSLGPEDEHLSQVATSNSTLTNTGNEYSGNFSTTEYQNNTTTLTQAGWNGSASYSLLTESMTDSPTITTTGNNIDGTDSVYETGDQTYSVSQFAIGTASYVLAETGSNAYTITGTDDSNSGESDRTQTGIDSYNLTEANDGTEATFNLVGSDNYTATSEQNSQTGAFSKTTTGSGSYTDTQTQLYNPTSISTGSTSFSDSEIGGSRDGGVTLTTSGTDRYDALVYPDGIMNFNNTADGTNGSASGLADYSPVGLPVLVTRTITSAGTFTDLGDAMYKYCFAAGTRVLMADGSTKAIEKIEPGEMVLAAPEHEPEATPTACRVKRVFHNVPARLHRAFVGGQSIRVTANHPFFVRGKGWTSAERLSPGDELRTPTGEYVSLDSAGDTDESEPVFNLEVDEHHTYFVQSVDGRQAVLVHNQSAPATQPAGDQYVPVQTITMPDGTRVVLQEPAQMAATQPALPNNGVPTVIDLTGPSPSHSGAAIDAAMMAVGWVPVVGNLVSAGNDLYHGNKKWFIADLLSIVGDESGAGEVEAEGRIAKNAINDADNAAAAEEHHIMTNKNGVSKAAGGPYTPKFEELATKRGINLEDEMNKMMLPGHQGPHPAYNAAVYERLQRATQGLQGDAFNQAFDRALKKIGKETATAGTALNRMATGG